MKHLLYDILDTGKHLIVLFRIMQFFYRRVPVVGRCIAHLFRQVIRVYTSCDISPRATIGRACRFPHPLGIVIGDGVVIGDEVGVWQRVTLGSHGRGGDCSYPIIGNRAKIYENASVLGAVTVGQESVIGAHSLVLCDVPQGKTAIGIPARIK